jgi:hypothetical protein
MKTRLARAWKEFAQGTCIGARRLWLEKNAN